MLKTAAAFAMVVVLPMLVGCSNPNPGPTGDTSFNVNAYLWPVAYPVPGSKTINTPSVSGSQYYVKVSVLSDSKGNVGSSYSDATITVNGEAVPYDSSVSYYHAILTGTYSAGSTFSVAVSHSGMTTISQTLTVPAASVPSGYTFQPALVSGSTTPPYTVTPTSSWPDSGTLIALLYDSGGVSTGYFWQASLAGSSGYTFTSANLSYGGGTVAAKVKFGVWAEDKIDLPSYGMSGSTPSRLRVFATDGFQIGST